ncbi:putative drug exporter of the RND superfamily [Georgenia satyanarayanai]|uniref:Putative drug exporter of the RND superfamily n=1 Tax=Georgenia satyanarayanai TaxID=860221 RepID=A0A2Y9C0K6_9MICO|nr:MMPL family transporter [Georgenia satyanarayanai]PYF97246.1 RND superfamily putative drug exporter [Georgenia satyanarayanai]SSA46332.1 putative drug exporter of the RND superfamily [Georgenia satyanarayanai]
MASLLHRLGRWSAQHRWATVVTWLVVIALAATGAATLSEPLSDEFSIPGSRFQVVLDDLQEEIPEAAAGIGTVTFSVEDGFTDEQRAAVADVTERWSALDGVVGATDPFATQEQLDGSLEEIEAGRAELAAGREQLEAGRAELEAGREQLEAAEAELAAGREQLEAQRAELEASIDMMPPAMAAGAEQELAAAEAELAAGEEQLAASRAELEAGEEELAAAEAEIAAGETQLDQGERLAELTDGLRQVSENGTVAMTQVQFESAGGQLDPEVTAEVQEIGDTLADEGVEVNYSAEIVSDISSILGPAEVVGVVVAVVVLLVLLGSLLAAGLPLLTALVGVGVGVGASLALSGVVEMTSVTPALALMLGMAVGIDYSLFILNRHRMQLADGMSVRDSIALATGTAGNAVTFAGATVVIALAALGLTGIPFLGVMGYVAAGTVVVAVLASVTLTPALLSFLGERVLPAKQRTRLARKNGADSRGWAYKVQQHPWLAIIGVVAITGLLAIPTTQLRLGLPDGSQEAADSTAYRTYDLIRDNFGAGANGPIIGVATLEEPTQDEAALTATQLDIAEDLLAVDGVQYVVPFGTSEDGDTLAFQVMPADGPSEESTVALVNTLLDSEDELGAAHGVQMGFTGQTVANIDISDQLADALPLYLLVVVGLSLVLLLLVFRSIWVPLLASVGFLLTVVASFGAVVGVYQLGFLSDLFGVNEAGPILSFLPVLLIGVLFGLAMDYQVFLVSGMREAHVHGADARVSVVRGFNQSARVVTAAAIIMISVFGGFIFAHLAMIRPIGFGLAFGVLVDAFLVRMTLTPAVLSLLGEKAWWLPRWLDKILPNVDVEGAKLERQVVAEERETV